jgi:hypothetical protein
MRVRISEKTAEVQHHSRNVEMEEANAALSAELAAVHTKVAAVENHERALSSDYGGLCSDFNYLQSVHAAVVKEKANVEKTEGDKAQRFRNLLHKKLAGLRRDMEESIDVLGSNAWTLPLLIPLSPTC